MFFLIYFISIILGLFALRYYIIEDFQKNELYEDFNEFLKSRIPIITFELIIILIPVLNLIYAIFKFLNLDKTNELLLKILKRTLFFDKKD